VRARIALTLAMVLAAALASSAHAATATRVGPPSLVTSDLTNEACGGAKCTLIQYRDSGANPAYVTPVSGVITQWQLASGSAGNAVSLRTLRPGAAAGTFAGLGTGVPRTTKTGLNTFQGERLPVEAGDSIGLDMTGDGLVIATGQAGAMVKWWLPALADAAGPSAPTNSSADGHSLQLNADVEPDSDGDRFGDITQDGCPGDPNRQALPCTVGPTNPILPVVTQLKASPRSIRFGQLSNIKFRISKTAHWTLRFEQRRPGRVKKGKCRLQTRSLKKGRKCTVYTSRGTVSGDGGPGNVTLGFQGALAGGRRIPTGKYRIKATAQDAIGTSKPDYALLTLKGQTLNNR
jgi:hypothetical protein